MQGGLSWFWLADATVPPSRRPGCTWAPGEAPSPQQFTLPIVARQKGGAVEALVYTPHLPHYILLGSQVSYQSYQLRCDTGYLIRAAELRSIRLEIYVHVHQEQSVWT